MGEQKWHTYEGEFENIQPKLYTFFLPQLSYFSNLPHQHTWYKYEMIQGLFTSLFLAEDWQQPKRLSIVYLQNESYSDIRKYKKSASKVVSNTQDILLNENIKVEHHI